MSHRPQKVASVIRRVVSAKLQQLGPGTYFGLTEIRVAPDLKTATIWLSQLDGQASAWALIEQHHQAIQRAVAAQLQSKFTPKLEFRPDAGAGHAATIDRLLGNLD